ncbi:MAG: membrane protein insertion efficiency factor YidD [Bacteriovoracaceae bacterium]
MNFSRIVISITTILVKTYQKALSPFLGTNCRFTPTCSEYALECVKKYPLYKAIFKIFYRIIRCHPFHPGGHDPS